jgi:hypothetical protein
MFRLESPSRRAFYHQNIGVNLCAVDYEAGLDRSLRLHEVKVLEAAELRGRHCLERHLAYRHKLGNQTQMFLFIMPETVPDNGVLADVVSGLAAFGRRWREGAGDWSVERSPRGGSCWGRRGGCRRLRRLPVCLGLGLGLGRDEVAFLDELGGSRPPGPKDQNTGVAARILIR